MGYARQARSPSLLRRARLLFLPKVPQFVQTTGPWTEPRRTTLSVSVATVLALLEGCGFPEYGFLSSDAGAESDSGGATGATSSTSTDSIQSSGGYGGGSGHGGSNDAGAGGVGGTGGLGGTGVSCPIGIAS